MVLVYTSQERSAGGGKNIYGLDAFENPLQTFNELFKNDFNYMYHSNRVLKAKLRGRACRRRYIGRKEERNKRKKESTKEAKQHAVSTPQPHNNSSNSTKTLYENPPTRIDQPIKTKAAWRHRSFTTANSKPEHFLRRLAYRPTNRPTDQQTNRPTDRQTDRPIDEEIDRENPTNL